MMREEASERGDLIETVDWRSIFPFQPAAASDRRGGVGREAARRRAEPRLNATRPP